MNVIKNLYKNSRFGFYLMKPFVRIYQFFQLRKYLPTEKYIQWDASRRVGFSLDLKNPKTFCEKLSWLKLHHTSRDMAKFADKYAVREHIIQKIGDKYLVPLHFTTKRPQDVIPKNLPDCPVIIKTNHNSSGGIIIRDKNDATINWDKIQNTLRWNLSENYYWNGRERQYMDIEPRIIVEELLSDENGKIPSDYKLHYFNGKLAFLHVDSDRATQHKTTFYNNQWEHMNCAYKDYPTDKPIPKPDCFDELLEIGSILAKDFVCIRIDFYILGSKIYFGELTFHHYGGIDEFEPAEYDTIFGNMLSIEHLIHQ